MVVMFARTWFVLDFRKGDSYTSIACGIVSLNQTSPFRICIKIQNLDVCVGYCISVVGIGGIALKDGDYLE